MSGDLHKLNGAALLERLGKLPTNEPSEPFLVGESAKRAHEGAEDARVHIHLKKCGVPEGLALATAAGKVHEGTEYPAVEVMRQWTTKDGAVFLLLAGGTGSGKTTAAVETLRLARSPFYGYDSNGTVFASWQYDSRKGLFVSATTLEEHAPWTDDGEELWKRVKKVPLLVVDDLGAESQNEKGPFLSAFQELVRHRHAEELRMVITTNVDGTTFKKRYGSRILDRITEKGVVHNCGTVSLRGRLAP